MANKECLRVPYPFHQVTAEIISPSVNWGICRKFIRGGGAFVEFLLVPLVPGIMYLRQLNLAKDREGWAS